MRRAWLAGGAAAAAVALGLVGAPRAAESAGPGEAAVFALVIGVNASPEPDVAPLQYADDDAARYLDLFRSLGARTTLLSTLDENTRRLHAQAAAEALAPRRPELDRAVAALARDVGQAKARGVATLLYVVYAGHGTVSDAAPYLTLEDGRLGGNELLAAVARVGADRSHVIVDACQAYLLAFSRGPGGERRPLPGFLASAATAGGNVGFLLASSTSGESHEWVGLQSGVFSHEVRSGLYGAADADGDGRVSYTEIAAFVARANEAVANERFRPQVLARAPRDGGALVDLRGARARELRLEGPASTGHHLLEDEHGVRLLDFHAAPGAAVRLARPAVAGPLYLRRVSDGAERTVPPSEGPVQLDALPVEAPRASARGAAHESFGKLFALAFAGDDVGAYARRSAEADVRFAEQQRRETDAAAGVRRRRVLGWSAAGGALAAGVTGALLLGSARTLHDDAPTGETHREAVERNDRIAARNLSGGALCALSGALFGAAVYLLWPRAEQR